MSNANQLLNEATALPDKLSKATRALENALRDEASARERLESAEQEEDDEECPPDAAREKPSDCSKELRAVESNVAKARAAFERLWAQSDATVAELQRMADDAQLALRQVGARIGEAAVAGTRGGLTEAQAEIRREIERFLGAAAALTKIRSDCESTLGSFDNEVGGRLTREGGRQGASSSTASRVVGRDWSAQPSSLGTAADWARAGDAAAAEAGRDWRADVGDGAESGWAGNLNSPEDLRDYTRNGRRAIELTENTAGEIKLGITDRQSPAVRNKKTQPTSTSSNIPSGSSDPAPQGEPSAQWNGRLGRGGMGSW